MKNTKYIMLSLLYEADTSYTETELINAVHEKCGTYPALHDDLHDLLNDALVQYHDTVADAYTPLQITTAGRNVYEEESERLSNHNPNKQRPFYKKKEFWVSAVIIPLVFFLLGVFVSYVQP